MDKKEQIDKLHPFGNNTDNVNTSTFNSFINKSDNLERLDDFMNSYYFKDGILVAYTIHGCFNDDYFIIY
jgi:hypothetical protein